MSWVWENLVCSDSWTMLSIQSPPSSTAPSEPSYTKAQKACCPSHFTEILPTPVYEPHPMWSHATDSYSVNKLIVVARLLSGRYRCESLQKHFSEVATGIFELCSLEVEDIEHIVLCTSRTDPCKQWWCIHTSISVPDNLNILLYDAQDKPKVARTKNVVLKHISNIFNLT